MGSPHRPFFAREPLQRLLRHVRRHVPDLDEAEVRLRLGHVAGAALQEVPEHGGLALLAGPDGLDFVLTPWKLETGRN